MTNSTDHTKSFATRLILTGVLLTSLLWHPVNAQAADPAPTFTGDKTTWHGFDRYDFTMDEQTLAITPITAPADEGDGIKGLVKGQRRCIVVVPKNPAPGNPWSWRGCYWDHEPQTEVELLKRGFAIAFVEPDPGKPWDAWYQFLTEQHAFSKKPAFIGMSKGGVNEYQWTTANPDKVSCIYADNPALYPESLQKIGLLASNDVPLLHVCGSLDFLLFHHTLLVEDAYHQLGGRITVMIKDGLPHHPHSLRDPRTIADWIEKNVQPAGAPFTLPGLTLLKSYYYSFENSYKFFPRDNTYVTCRGPAFTDCYERYDAKSGFNFSPTGIAILVPANPAAGKPWVFRADRIDRAEPSPVDLALLAKGIYIVAAPVDTQAGAVQKQWDDTYKVLTDAGFSKKPAMEGFGPGAGEAYAWAIANPDKVSCIYAENPYLRSLMFPKMSLTDNLSPLAKASVPLLNICGSLDPLLAGNSNVAVRNYKKLGGRITVILKKGEGHYLTVPADPTPVVDFIVKNATAGN